jgi:hypothetical protein
LHLASKRRGYAPYLWTILLALGTLAALCSVDALTTTRVWTTSAAYPPAVGSASHLEPVFSLPAGYYDHTIQLRISSPSSSNDEAGDVIFTVDGTLPTFSTGTTYTHPIHLSAAAPAVTVIRARAVLADGTLGPVVSSSYFVGVSATLPMMSLIVDPEDLWDPENGIFARFHERGDAWERRVDITYVDRNRDSGFNVPGGIRVHGGGSRSFPKQSMRLYFRQEYGLSRLEYPVFADSHVRSFKRLVLHASGQDCPNPRRGPFGNWTLMRNQLADDLTLELGGYASHNQPILLFINGEPWGVYTIRERLEARFLVDNYGIDSADFIKAPEVVPGEVIYSGDKEHWSHLLQFVETHDLADPANYAYLETQVDIANLVDYNILQIYAANPDWPHHNVHQFRPRVQGGRWQWLLWDTDSGFGAYPVFPYSRVDSDWVEHVLEYNHPKTEGRDLLLLRSLLGTPAFLERFLSRTADLLNTTLAPQSVIGHIDALAAELEPDIAYEMIRWPNSADWAANVEELRDFARRRPHFVRQHMVEWFDLQGTAPLILNRPSGGSGTVAINGILVEDLPWQGTYFQGIPIRIVAAPTPGYRFVGWEPLDLPQNPAITLTIATTQTITPRFELVGGDTPRPGDVVFTGYTVDGDSSSYTVGQGDQIELLVTRPGGVDLRGWRVTDNDSKTATNEGSLIFGDNPALARVPQHTTIQVVATLENEGDLPEDDLDAWDWRMVLYVGNGNLDTSTDPGFTLGANDNVVLLAPGRTEAFGDDQGIAFVSHSASVTPASFGVLADGLLTNHMH